MTKVQLKLFITGHTARSQRAIANLRQISQGALQGQCELLIVDVLEQPQLAEKEKVLATPMLIREFPPPIRVLIGDLSDRQKVLEGLGVSTISQQEQLNV